MEDVPLSEFSRRPTSSGAELGVCELLATLAWAVTHRMPFPAALRTMMPLARCKNSLVALPKLGWKRLFFFSWGKTRWAIRLARIIEDLDHGEALAATLDRRLGRVIPWYCLAAISRAEKEGNLARALPILARQMSRRVPLEAGYPLAEIYPWAFVRQIPVFAICVFFPFFFSHWTFSEFLSPYAYAWGTALLVGHLALVTGLLLAGLLTVSCLLPRVGERVLFIVPFLGTVARLKTIRDMALSMAMCVREGDDLLPAAEWTRSATRSLWLKKRLSLFIDAVRTGTSWETAWEQMALDTSFEQWLIHNAQAREAPVSGFEFLAAWLDYRIRVARRRLQRWLDPAVTIATACFVALCAGYMYVNIILIRVEHVQGLIR